VRYALLGLAWIKTSHFSGENGGSMHLIKKRVIDCGWTPVNQTRSGGAAGPVRNFATGS